MCAMNINTTVGISFTWLCWSWSMMRRREIEDEEVEGEILCTVQQLRRRSGQASEPSRKSSVCRCSTLLSRPSLSSIREPATKWGRSQGKLLGEAVEEEMCSEEGLVEASSFVKPPALLELFGETCMKECPEIEAAFVDLCDKSGRSLGFSRGEWGRLVLKGEVLALSTLGKYSVFLSPLLMYGPLCLL